MVFEHVEKLVTVAASLHRKFLEAPRLAQVIFSDFYSTYDPVMGINSNDEENKSRTVSSRYTNGNVLYYMN